MKPDFYIRVLLNAATRTPDLAKCTRESFLRCTMDLAAVGVAPDNRRAYLIPRWNKRLNSFECTYIIGYMGLVELITRSGWACNAEKVCKEDVFSVEDMVCRHGIDPSRPRGPVIAYWATARHPDGRRIDSWMILEEVNAIRRRFHGEGEDEKFSPWVSDADAMGCKTVLRKLSKLLPLTPEVSAFIHAEDAQIERVRTISAKSVSDQLVDTLTGAEPESPPVIETPVFVEKNPEPATTEELPPAYKKAWWTAVVGQKTTVAELDALLADLESDPGIPADVRSHAKTQIAVAKKAVK